MAKGIRTVEEGLALSKSVAQKFLKENYNMELDIPIVENSKLKRAYGRFVVRISRGIFKRESIEMSRLTLKYLEDFALIDIVKHECIHYALYKLGRAYDDGEKDFENELKKYNVSSNYRPSSYAKAGYKAVFKCCECSKIITSKRRDCSTKTTRQYRSSCCKADIEFVERYVFTGIKKINLSRTTSL